MKLSASNLKNLNYKQLMANHGEKIVLGLVGAFALLAIMGTTWSTYQKTPQQLKEKAELASATIEQGAWPESEQSQYPSNDTLKSKIDRMQQPLNLAQNKPSIDPSFELYIPDKLHEAPALQKVEQLLARHFKLIIAQPTSETDLASTTGAEGGKIGEGGKKTETKKKKSRFKPVNGTNNPPTTSGGTPMPMKGMPPGQEAGGGEAGPGEAGPMGMEPGYTGGEGGGTDMVSLTEGKGYHAVSVVGIFNIAKQAKEFARALNLPSDDVYSVRPKILLYDTIVERQTSTNRGKSWSKWENLDLGAYGKFYRDNVTNYDQDVVDRMVTDPGITSPLPMRLLLDWSPEDASHPALENYNMTEDAKKRQAELDALLAKEKKALKKAEQANYGQRGFAPQQVNMPSVANEVMGNTSSRNRLTRGLNSMYNPMGEQPEMAREMMSKITAAGHLLLYRFFDFTAEPGDSYRYRVKLVLINPNYKKPIQLLAPNFQHTVTKLTVETDFSNITDPVHIPLNMNYFVNRVNHRNSQNDLKLIPETVNLTVYDWKSKFGTTVKGELKELKVGQKIQGKDKKTEVLDIAKYTLLEDQETNFSLNTTVVDITAGRRQISSELASELNLPARMKKRSLAVYDQVLVVDQLGRLSNLDPMKSRANEISAEDGWKELMDHFSSLRTAAPEGTEGMGPTSLEDLTNAGEGGPYGSKKRSRKRRRSALRPMGGGYSPYGPGGPGAGSGSSSSGGTGYSPYAPGGG